MRKSFFSFLPIVCLLFSFVSLAPQTDDASIQGRIDAAMQLASFDEKVDELSYILSEIPEGATYSEPTKTKFFNALKYLFDNRLDKKYNVPTETGSVEWLYLLFYNASSSPLLLAGDAGTVGGYVPTTLVEKIIFDLKASTNFEDQIDTLYQLLSQATNLTDVSGGVQTIFFSILKGVFDNRTTPDKMALRTTTSRYLTRLKTSLGMATTTPLLNTTDRGTVATYLAIFNLEVSIAAVSAVADYATQLDTLKTIADANQTGTFQIVTQNIFYTTVVAVANKRSALTPDVIISKTLSNKLFTFLSGITTNPLLNTTTQRPAIQTLLGTAGVEKNIEAIMALTDYNAKLDALIAVANLAKTRTIAPITQTLFMYVLQNIFDNRPRQDLTILNKFKNNTLPATVIPTTLLNDSTRNTMLAAINADLLALQRLDLIIAAATNTTPITQLANSTRLIEMGKILTENTGKTLDTTTEGKVFSALEKAFTTRAHTQSELSLLKTLFDNWANSNLLTTDHAATVRSWFTLVDSEIKIILLPPTTPVGPGGPLDPSNFQTPPPLDPKLQNQIFIALQNAFNNRNKTDLTALTNLRTLLKAWVDSNKLPDYNTTINGWIVILNSEITQIEIRKKFEIDPWTDPNSFPPGITLDPITQDLVFAKLQNLYNTRVQQLDPLQKLLDLFTSWLNKNLLKPAQNTTISGTWIPQLNKEINALTSRNLINTLDPATVTIGNMRDLLNALKDIILTPAEQDKVFILLKALYDRRQPVIQELVDLQTLLTAWLNSNKLRTEQNNTIRNEWLPTIAKEIDLLTKRKQLDDILTKPFDPTTGPRTLGGPLNDIYLKYNGQQIDPATELKIFDALQKLYDNRDKTNLAALTELQTTLTKYVNSTLLNADHKNTINTTWLPTITAEIAALQLAADLKKIGDITDNNVLITSLDDFLKNNGGKPLDEATELRIFDLLTRAYQNRGKTVALLTPLNTLLTNWLNSNLLLPEHNNTIQNEWLPTIASEINTINILQAIKTALAKTDYVTKLNALQSVITNADGKPFSDTVRTAFYNALAQAFSQRQQVDTILSALLQLLNNAINSTLLTDTDKALVQNNMISIVTQELAALSLAKDIRAAIALADYGAKLDALTAIITSAGTGTMAPSIQDLFFSAVGQVFNTRPRKDITMLEKLILFLTSAGNSSLLNPTQQTTDKTTMLTVVQAEVNAFKIEQSIRDAMAMTDYMAELDALSAILDVAKGGVFAGSTQNLFASALVQVFNDRVKQQLDALKKLALVLTASLTTPLLAKVQQDYVKAMLDTLSVEIAINTALSMADYGDQLDALLEMIFQYKEIRVVDPRVQTLFFDALKRVFANRISQYERTDQDDTNLDKLALLLLNAEESTLLIQQSQTAVSAFGDMVTFEQMIADTFRQSYTLQLGNTSRIVRSAEDKSFDTITNNLFFDLLKKLFDGRDPGNTSNIELLKQTLTASVTAPLLSFEQQQYVKNVMLPMLGVSLTTSVMEQNISSIMQQSDLQTKITSLIQLNNQMKTQKVDPQSQLIFMSALRQLMGSPDAQQPGNAKILGQLFSTVQTSPLLSKQDQQYVTTTIIPTIQPGVVTTSKAITTAAIPDVTITEIQLPTILPTTVPALTPTVGVIQAIKSMPSTSAQIDTLSILLDNAAGLPVDAATQKAFDAALGNIIQLAQQNKLDPVSQAKLIQLSQKIQGSTLVSQQQQNALNTVLPKVKTAVNKAFAPTAGAIKALTQITDTNALIDALSIAADNTAGKTFDAATQKAVAAALDRLVKESATADPATQDRILNLMQKISSSSLVSAQKQAQIVEANIPNIVDNITKAATPTVQRVKTVAAQKDVSAKIDSLSSLVEKMPDDATTKEIINTISSLAKSSKTLNAIDKAKLESLIQKAQTALPLTEAQQQQLIDAIQAGQAAATVKTTTAKPTTTAAKPTTTKPTTTVSPRQDQAEKPTSSQIKEAAQQKDSAKKIAAIQSLLDRAQNETFDATTQNEFAKMLDALVKDNLTADAATLNKIAAIVQKAATTPLLASAQQEYVANTLQPQVQEEQTIASTPTVESIKRIEKQTDPTLKLQALATMMTQAAGQTPDAATQKELETAIKQILAQKQQLSTQDKQLLAQVVKQAQSTTLLTQAQQESIATAMATPAKPAPTPDAVTVTGKPTIAQIQQAVAQKDLPTKLAALESIIDRAQTETFDAKTQNELAKVLDTLVKGNLTADAATLNKIAALVQKAAKTPLLAQAQQDYVANTLQPQVQEEQATANTPTVEAIKRIEKQTNPALKLQALATIMAQAEGQTPDAATQKELETAIKQILAQKQQLSTQDKQLLAQVVQQAQSTTLLTQAQQESIATAMAAPVSTKPGTPASVLAQGKPTIAQIQQAVAQKDLPTKLAALESIIDRARTETFDAATQNELAKALDALVKDNLTADAATLNKIAAIVQKAATTPLLAQAQQDYVANTLQPQVQAEQAIASTPTVEAIKRIDQQVNPTLKIAALTELMQQAVGQTVQADAQKAFENTIKQIVSQAGKLSPTDKAQLVQLLEQSKTNPFAETIQQTISTLIAQVQAVTPTAISTKPTAKPTTTPVSTAPPPTYKKPIVRKIAKPEEVAVSTKRTVTSPQEVQKAQLVKQLDTIKRSGVFVDKVNALNKLADWARNKSFPQDQQNLVRGVIKDIFDKLATAKPTEKAQFKTALTKILATKILSDDQKNDINQNIMPAVSK